MYLKEIYSVARSFLIGQLLSLEYTSKYIAILDIEQQCHCQNENE